MSHLPYRSHTPPTPMSGTIRPPNIPEILVSRKPVSTATRVPRQHRGSVSTSSGPRDSSPKPGSHSTHSLQPHIASGEPEQDPQKACEDCESDGMPIWNCSNCGMNFCDACWTKQAPHKPGRKGPDGLPHEKADPAIVKRLKNIFTPPVDHAGQQTLHMEDEDTTWFGTAREDGKPVLQDYGRYPAIMADSNTGDFNYRYPQLVSFIGKTGAGKSTLIKMLIDQRGRKNQSPEWEFPSPVVGSLSNANVPTSGDVHLYSDPGSYAGEYPMLYADCEGLEGGENLPMSAQYRNAASAPLKEKDRDNTIHHRKLRKVSHGLRCTAHDIMWQDSPEKSKRQYAVNELYPRLLYTFSDVIVFVLRNPKTFECTVLSLLITWAASSLEKSVNQPTLPHAVIALNATDLKVDQREWDPEYATRTLMNTVSRAIHRDPVYKYLRDQWQDRGKNIHTMQDLLECYYSSITVLIDDQIQKLQRVLNLRCNESLHSKKRSRMLSNSDNLNVYLQCAFGHFSRDLHTPFDFMDVSSRINPIPSDFGGNILKLSVALIKIRANPVEIFEELSYMIASCILLDCVRLNLKGTADQIFEKRYLVHCEYALQGFCAIFWPCTFQHPKRGRCVNVSQRHNKGHQNARQEPYTLLSTVKQHADFVSARGQIIGSGLYQSDFTFKNLVDDWYRHLKRHLKSFQAKLDQETGASANVDELNVMTKIHHANINEFYRGFGGAQNFINHSTCFCCLADLAEHPLPCGHILCTRCIKGFGTAHKTVSGVYFVSSCPLHHRGPVFQVPWQVSFKPQLAGVRVLSLDGGGMRGIVILEVLRKLQEELGNSIPILDFFDLVAGTSTGGILALGLGLKNWSVDHCTKMFLNMVDRAFTPKILGLGGVKFGTTKYRTQPLQDALRDTFKEEMIFGGKFETPKSGRKVAVTSSNDTGGQAVIFTNYNRAASDQVDYKLDRPDHPDNDLKIWEAARATFAAPTYFKPFVNSRTKEGYLDGAVLHNNPVQIAHYESKLLWPDSEDLHPDILLSIGTGHHDLDTDGHLDPSRDGRGSQIRRVINQIKPKSSYSALSAFPQHENWIQVVTKRVQDQLDTELRWKKFRKDIVGNSCNITAARYIRINPETELRTPNMDDKSQVHDLQDEVRSKLRTHGMSVEIEAITHRLVASSFYFEKSGPLREAGDRITIQGNIRCRFDAGSTNLRNLGRYIQGLQTPTFQPYLIVHEVNYHETVHKIYITDEVILDMVHRGSFQLESIAITATSESALLSIDLHLIGGKNQQHQYSSTPISGFPRSFGEKKVL
ncbi:hypothetical protein BS50DRAFT_594903 [Corynespora cassiicola Philippines]|uniref:FabD/lysophospholipase-like protein n=1 Tax=Corynespora cassiicola Philippines TaxID=1448308 RepID=A0A2T2N1K0_CORCC|nr:hypothetical protein BS50DRAFT_594903 [Corynespora cassiicola Philippines]